MFACLRETLEAVVDCSSSIFGIRGTRGRDPLGGMVFCKRYKGVFYSSYMLKKSVLQIIFRPT